MKYSIITVNYNNRDGLRKTIESVINQTYQGFEYIIIDGGSTDGSVEVIKEYADRITYWVSESDKGIYNAMNKGILQAHGEYLNFMNSGDCFHDCGVLDRIVKQCVADIFVGRVANIGCDGNLVSYNMEAKRISMYHFFISTLPHQGCFIKRTLFGNHLYDESLRIVSDWKFFMECIVFRGCRIIQSDMVIADCEQRGVSGMMSDLLKEKELILKSIIPIGVYEDYQSLSQLGIVAFDELVYIIQYPCLRKFLCKIMRVIICFHRLFSNRLNHC